MADYLHMGGYALYVWGSYLLTALVLGALFLGALRTLQRRERELEALRSLAPHRRARAERREEGS